VTTSKPAPEGVAILSDGPVCYIHGVVEPDLPGDYKVCAECWHVWRTEAEFRVDVAAVYSDRTLWDGVVEPVPDDLSKVWACPLCTHDF
jgi:hypothetical protein